MAQASWLEIQHWGTSFHSLLGNKVALVLIKLLLQKS